MTSSGQTPRIRRTAYEPATAQPQASIVACPHCRATFAVGAAAGAVEEADVARAAVPVDLPDAGALRVPVARVLGLVLEVIDGRRPARQLEGVVAPSVLRYARAARLAEAPVRVSRLRSLRMCRPTEQALEAAAVVVIGQRVRAPPESTKAVGAAMAVAVVTSPFGVLAGRRRDGIPRWVFPGGTIEDDETAEHAAVRECAKETGLVVVADHEIGHRAHPVTGQQLTYIACTSTAGLDVRAAAPDELVEARWIDPSQVEELMPDLFDPVREHIDSQRP